MALAIAVGDTAASLFNPGTRARVNRRGGAALDKSGDPRLMLMGCVTPSPPPPPSGRQQVALKA